jgi:2-oxoglutarate ferredoxin oxidoreductase subunit alpha
VPDQEVTFRIGGEAGQGVESGGMGFVQALTFAGLYAIGIPNYFSRIRGGQNFYTIRASDQPVYAITDTVDLLLCLNAETLEWHIGAIAPGGIALLDDETKFDEELTRGRDVQIIRAPVGKIAEQHGNKIMKNTGFLAVAGALAGVDVEPIIAVIHKNFRVKGDKVVRQNEAVARDSYEWARQQAAASRFKLPQVKPQPRVALSGNQAFSIGSIVAGCKFTAGYPMTPSTSILEYIAEHADDWGMVFQHAEDEISAINMAIGAAHAGVRAMVATSGGGFDLMTEGLSLAGITETPVVVYLGQRPGPATGLATRTAQGDLFLAWHAAHGEFPRVILAPHTPAETFDCAIRAFNIAEKYQCLVIVLSDQYLASLAWATDLSTFNIENAPIDRGKLLSTEELEQMDEYQRFAVTPDGVSPRAIPGSSPKAVYLTTANEHAESGHITEDAATTVAQVSKRLRKLDAARAEIRPPYRFGPEEADVTFVAWGSSYGPVYEAMQSLNAQGTPANMVHFVDLWPFPREEARKALSNARRIIDVEGNAQAQFAYMLQAETGIQVDQKILRYDGRSFTPGYILDRLEGSGNGR